MLITSSYITNQHAQVIGLNYYSVYYFDHVKDMHCQVHEILPLQAHKYPGLILALAYYSDDLVKSLHYYHEYV